MAAFINGTGLISPQKTAETQDFLKEITETESDFLKCIEPAYRSYIDPIAGRRMSRLIKMGISSAKMCIADAGVSPDAIITGTGLGSVEDTEKILSTMREDEKFFNPTPFIQSTYNTISSQIAISTKCHGYNSTYVHRIFSLENGLQDAMMQMEEGIAENILVGGVDEMTLNHLHITRRAGHWKMVPVNNLSILSSGTPGALAGEGSAWFMLSGQRSENSYAELKAVETYLGKQNPEKFISDFLHHQNVSADDIDLVLTGHNGDSRYDHVYDALIQNLFPKKPAAYFKHLCGEYHTASGFALWLSARIIKLQEVPESIRLNDLKADRIRNIVIYNQFQGTNHSAILITP